MVNSRRIAVFAAGMKGATFVVQLVKRGIAIGSIASYPQANDFSHSFEKLSNLARKQSMDFLETKHPVIDENSLTFLVGWQYLLPKTSLNTVVFHDSLLPRYRGFAPTVTALIRGDTEIGVTALQPVDAVDQGPIIAQRALPISYPIKIARALELQAHLMVDLAVEIVQSWEQGTLSAAPQREDLATYSIWRDERDFEIDWNDSADTIQRFVDALGHPYGGARTSIGESEEAVWVRDATIVPEMTFELRQPGKIWAIDNGRPIVICGKGMLRLEDCRREDGSQYKFHRLRLRLGSSAAHQNVKPS